MYDIGCAAIILALLVAPGVIFLHHRTKEEMLKAAAKRERAVKIVAILEHLAKTPADKSRAVAALIAHLQAGPIGFLPELTGEDRWFERCAPSLRLLLREGSDARVVEWYFSCFTFVAGQQTPVLTWLNAIITEEKEISPGVLQSLVDRILPHGGQADASWLYQRVLEALRARSDDGAFRAFALHLGRLSYAFSRPDKASTVYDEQAIANDIAVARG